MEMTKIPRVCLFTNHNPRSQERKVLNPHAVPEKRFFDFRHFVQMRYTTTMTVKTLEQPKPRAIFLDRDGTLGGAGGFRQPDKFEFYDFTFEAIKLINQAGFKAIVISNQSRIAKGQITSSQLENSIDRLNSSLENHDDHDAKLDAWFVCSHQNSDECNCKKPKPGLFLQAAQELKIDLANSFMIGDHGNDMLAGATAGCKPVLVLTGLGRKSIGEFRHAWDSVQPAFVAQNVLEAVQWILEHQARNESTV
jgi:D,D-heptose 1,7-bisphosphate phosphatase